MMKSKLCKRLNIEFPLFAFSHCRDVVAEVSKAGGFGVLGAAGHTPESLEVELSWLDAHVGGASYGVDLIVPTSMDAKEGGLTAEEIEARIKEEAQLDLDITRVDWFSTYRVHTRHVEKFSAGRCFLAGDSAHIHTPAGGQGMNTGIQDAYNLAWKMAYVLRGDAGERLLRGPRRHAAQPGAGVECVHRRRDRRLVFEAADDRDHLPAPAPLPAHPRRLVLRQKHLPIRAPRAPTLLDPLPAPFAGHRLLKWSSVEKTGHELMIPASTNDEPIGEHVM